MTGEIVEKRLIAEGTLYTKFAFNEEVSFKAGQFFRLTLINPPYTDERGNGRFLGFINSPTQNKVVETVTRLGPSAFKRFLNEAPEGTEVEIGGIDGEMTLPESSQTSWVIITGGIGIVPYMSMFRLIKEKALDQKITLIYSNTKASWAIFIDELTHYAQESPNFNFIPTMTQDPAWQGEKRRIDETFLKEKVPQSQNNLYYVSGTPRFVPSIVKAVKAIGAAQDKLKFEIFTGY
jgi:ferredoxin-NADP reductase